MCVRLPCRSIIIWSICNEVLCETSDTDGDGTRLHDLFHALDPKGQRVVSANYNSWDGVRSEQLYCSRRPAAKVPSALDSIDDCL